MAGADHQNPVGIGYENRQGAVRRHERRRNCQAITRYGLLLLTTVPTSTDAENSGRSVRLTPSNVRRPNALGRTSHTQFLGHPRNYWKTSALRSQRPRKKNRLAF